MKVKTYGARTYKRVMGVLVIPPVNESCEDAFSCHDIDKHSIHADPFQRQEQVPYAPDINLAGDDVNLSFKNL